MENNTKTFNPNDHLIQLKGKDYLEVKYRLVWFRQENPAGIIEPELVERGDGWALFKATVTKDDGGVAVAHAQETTKDFAEYLEKAETKAVGRALGMLGYGTQFAPDLDFEESGKDKVVDAPANSSKAASRTSHHTVNTQTGEVLEGEGVKCEIPSCKNIIKAEKVETSKKFNKGHVICYMHSTNGNWEEQLEREIYEAEQEALHALGASEVA